ncbi:MAP3K7 C-terminal-like protein isoform X2 [Meriones unguiculatus]|uniref:MAP3K7 C-terminal-like protein isoform X2 n=1 Tax=Meriones unguiculatus TaxID=10047 RepID=UPI00293F5A55|nr:MAP3K7 C-terminal-like protein isoform X2 [Meriones unguiculatus]
MQESEGMYLKRIGLRIPRSHAQADGLEDPGEGRASGAHMISTARVPADKPVRIAFSLNDAADDTPSEDAIPLVFPELEQQLQPLPPCHDSVESMQVFKQHCQIAEEYHEVKKEIALLEERKKCRTRGEQRPSEHRKAAAESASAWQREVEGVKRNKKPGWNSEGKTGGG